MIEQFVRDTLASGGKIFGFGHAVLRAEIWGHRQYGVGQEICPDDPLFKTALAMRACSKSLEGKPQDLQPLSKCGCGFWNTVECHKFTDSDYFLFGLPESQESLQIVDERVHMRNGRGVPICRCSYIAENQDPRRLG